MVSGECCGRRRRARCHLRVETARRLLTQPELTMLTTHHLTTSLRLATPMNVYALVHSRILDALKALQAEGALPAGLDFAHVEVAPPRDAAHGDLASNAALVLAKAAKMKPRDIAELLAAKLKADPDIEKVEVAGPGFRQPRLPAGVLAGRRRRHPERRAELWARRPWPRRAGQCRIRVRESDGAAACGPRPRGSLRRRALEPAGLHRLRRNPRVLRQRCRCPSRYPGALRVLALPRGSGPGHRRDSCGSLSRRLPEAGWQGPGG